MPCFCKRKSDHLKQQYVKVDDTRTVHENARSCTSFSSLEYKTPILMNQPQIKYNSLVCSTFTCLQRRRVRGDVTLDRAEVLTVCLLVCCTPDVLTHRVGWGTHCALRRSAMEVLPTHPWEHMST